MIRKEITNKAEIKLIGIAARTNNRNEMDVHSAKIGITAGYYWQNNIAQQIPNRVKPGVTFAIYTDYESDEKGDYTYFIGEIVSSAEKIPEGLSQVIIPPGTYIRFTTESGVIPNVVISAWQQIWNMQKIELGGERAFQADFEVYDDRAIDPNNTSLDIYIGIKA